MAPNSAGINFTTSVGFPPHDGAVEMEFQVENRRKKWKMSAGVGEGTNSYRVSGLKVDHKMPMIDGDDDDDHDDDGDGGGDDDDDGGDDDDDDDDDYHYYYCYYYYYYYSRITI